MFMGFARSRNAVSTQIGCKALNCNDRMQDRVRNDGLDIAARLKPGGYYFASVLAWPRIPAPAATIK